MADVLVGAVTVSYPDDFPKKRGGHPSQMQALAWGAQSAPLPPAPVTARALFPDRIPRRPVLIQGGASAPAQTFATVVPLFGWKGYQPAWIARRRLAASAQVFSVLGSQAINTVRLEWAPNYPDRVPAPQRLWWHLESAMNLDPIPNPPSPDLAWGPSYPDQIWPLVRLRAAAQQAVAEDPRIMPPSPDLAWQGDAPDWIDRRTLPVSSMPSVSYVERVANIAPDIGMNWKGAGPDRVDRAPRVPETTYTRPAEVPVSPVVWLAERLDPPDVPIRRTFTDLGGQAPMGALIVIGSQMAWQSDSPIPMRARGPIQPFGPMVVGPVTPVIDEWCITIDDEVGNQPVFAAQAVYVATFAEQAVISPTLANPEVC